MEFVQPVAWTDHAMLPYGALAAFFTGNAIMELTGIAQIRAVWLGLFTTASVTEAPDMITWIGIATFAAGTVINAYHHLLLANLRARGSNEYVIPWGGLFNVIVCPHYLGELLAWLSICAREPAARDVISGSSARRPTCSSDPATR